MSLVSSLNKSLLHACFSGYVIVAFQSAEFCNETKLVEFIAFMDETSFTTNEPILLVPRPTNNLELWKTDRFQIGPNLTLCGITFVT